MRTVKENLCICFTVFLLIVFAQALAAGKVFAEQQTPARTETADGLHTVTFETPEGKITVNLPDDMAAGDTISGVVVAEPAGESAKEIEESSDELNGYVVDIEVEDKEIGETKIRDGELKKVSIPKDFSTGEAKITLSSAEGDNVATADLPVRSSPHPLQYSGVPSARDFKLPRIGISGEPIVVLGPFDGAFDTSGVKIGGKQARALAESPRKIIVTTPYGIKGPAKIEVVERGVRSSGKIHIADTTAPYSGTSLDGTWRTKSGETVWKISHTAQGVSAELVKVGEQDRVRGYREGANILRGSLRGNLLVGKTQQFFLMPLKECMAMCPTKCEQWNDIELILSEGGNALSGQIAEKAINTKTCAVIEFGWIPWSMIKQ